MARLNEPPSAVPYIARSASTPPNLSSLPDNLFPAPLSLCIPPQISVLLYQATVPELLFQSVIIWAGVSSPGWSFCNTPKISIVNWAGNTAERLITTSGRDHRPNLRTHHSSHTRPLQVRATQSPDPVTHFSSRFLTSRTITRRDCQRLPPIIFRARIITPSACSLRYGNASDIIAILISRITRARTQALRSVAGSPGVRSWDLVGSLLVLGILELGFRYGRTAVCQCLTDCYSYCRAEDLAGCWWLVEGDIWGRKTNDRGSVES